MLWINGRDLRHTPLRQRKRRLEKLIPASVGALNRIPCFEAEGRELFEATCRLDLEGIVAKRRDDPGNLLDVLPHCRRGRGAGSLELN